MIITSVKINFFYVSLFFFFSIQISSPMFSPSLLIIFSLAVCPSVRLHQALVSSQAAGKKKRGGGGGGDDDETGAATDIIKILDDIIIDLI